MSRRVRPVRPVTHSQPYLIPIEAEMEAFKAEAVVGMGKKENIADEETKSHWHKEERRKLRIQHQQYQCLQILSENFSGLRDWERANHATSLTHLSLLDCRGHPDLWLNKRPGRDRGGGGGPVAASRVHDGRGRRLHARRHRVVHLLLVDSLVAGANLRYGQRAKVKTFVA